MNTAKKLALTLGQGGGASAFAPSPAPQGWHWEFVYEDNSMVTEDGRPVVELVRN